MIDLRSLQRALGGEISGRQLLCPGPGHSPRDRSLAVRPSPDGDGFVVHSHCGDAWTLCKDYVRRAARIAAVAAGRRARPARRSFTAQDLRARRRRGRGRAPPADAGRSRPYRARPCRVGRGDRPTRHAGGAVPGVARTGARRRRRRKCLTLPPRCPLARREHRRHRRNTGAGRGLSKCRRRRSDGSPAHARRPPKRGRRSAAACSASCTAPP